MKAKKAARLKKSVITNHISDNLAYCLNLDSTETDVLKVEGVSCRFLEAVQKGTGFEELYKQLASAYELNDIDKPLVKKDFDQFVDTLKSLHFV